MEPSVAAKTFQEKNDRPRKKIRHSSENPVLGETTSWIPVSCTEWGTTFRKNFRRVVRIVKYLKNERITLAWRLFYFWPIKKIRLQKKVRRFWIQNQWILWRWERFSIRKSMKHQPWSTITTDVLLKYTDLKSMLFVMCSEISNFF